MSGTLCTCGRPTAGAWLCDRCQGTFAIAIANIAAYYPDLETVLTKHARFGSNAAIKGSIGKEQPLPIDGRFADPTGRGTQLRWDTWNTITTWCRTVMEEQPELTGPACGNCWHPTCTAIRRRRWPSTPTIKAMCLYLDRQFRWIVRERWAPEILDELLDVEKRLARFLDRPADRWYAGKCTVIGGVDLCPTELYATIGRGSITCPTCDTEHDIAKRRDDLLDQAKDHLVTATEAAGALLAWTDYSGSELSLIKRISKWRERKVLEPRGEVMVNGKERVLYRLGDVQDRMIDDAQRQQARAIPA